VPWAVVEHTADIGIEVRAATLEALFVDAAAGFCDVITEVSGLGAGEESAFELDATGLDLLLGRVARGAALPLRDHRRALPAGEASVEGKGDSWSLRARMRGERFDASATRSRCRSRRSPTTGLEGGTRRAGLARARDLRHLSRR
jgi:SHS2 domain-containing protein